MEQPAYLLFVCVENPAFLFKSHAFTVRLMSTLAHIWYTGSILKRELFVRQARLALSEFCVPRPCSLLYADYKRPFSPLEAITSQSHALLSK